QVVGGRDAAGVVGIDRAVGADQRVTEVGTRAGGAGGAGGTSGAGRTGRAAPQRAGREVDRLQRVVLDLRGRDGVVLELLVADAVGGERAGGIRRAAQRCKQ